MKLHPGGRLLRDPWFWAPYRYPAYCPPTGPMGIPDTDRRRLLPIQIVLQGIGSHRNVVVPSPARLTGPHRRHPAYASSPRGPIHGGEWRPPSAYERARNLSRLFLLHSEEDDAVRTFLETAYALFDLLSGEPDNLFTRGVGPNLAQGARAQMDLLVRAGDGPYAPVSILSIWFGGDTPPIDWAGRVRRSAPWGATNWIRIGFAGDGPEPASSTNAEGRTLLRTIRDAEGTNSPPPPSPLTSDILPRILHVGGDATRVFPSAYGPAHRRGPDPYAVVPEAPRGRRRRRERPDAAGRQTGEFTMWDWDRAAPGLSDPVPLDEAQQAFADLGLGSASCVDADVILLIDDLEDTLGPLPHPELWAALVRLLDQNPRMTVVATTRKLGTALFLTRQFSPDLLVGGRQPVRIRAG